MGLPTVKTDIADHWKDLAVANDFQVVDVREGFDSQGKRFSGGTIRQGANAFRFTFSFYEDDDALLIPGQSGWNTDLGRFMKRSFGLIQPKLGEMVMIFKALTSNEALSRIIAKVGGISQTSPQKSNGSILLRLGWHRCLLSSGAMWNSNEENIGTYCLLSPKGINSQWLIEQVANALQDAGATEDQLV